MPGDAEDFHHAAFLPGTANAVFYAANRFDDVPSLAEIGRCTVLRHEANRKWFAVGMTVRRDRLGLAGEGTVDVVNVKCDPLMSGSFLSQPGILPAYHMNKLHWLGILPDQADRQTVEELLEISYTLTMPKKRRRQE